MIDSGTQMRSIDLDKLLIEHNVVCGIEQIVTVPVHSCQYLLKDKETHAVILIHGKHGLPSLQIVNYLTYIPFVAEIGHYKEYIFNEGVRETPIFVKSNGCPMQTVQLKSTIDELDIKRGEYRYACTTHGLSHNKR